MAFGRASALKVVLVFELNVPELSSLRYRRKVSSLLEYRDLGSLRKDSGSSSQMTRSKKRPSLLNQ